MKVEVLVKPKSSRNKLEETGPCRYTAWVHEPPLENRANLAVIELLAENFKVSKSAVLLFRGSKGKKKIFEISLETSTKIKAISKAFLDRKHIPLPIVVGKTR